MPIKKLFTVLSIGSLFIFKSAFALGNTQEIYGTPGNFTWVAPTGVTWVTVYAWGAGGSGGSAQGSPSAAGGGAGGAFVSSTLTVVPGTGYAIKIAATTTAADAVVNGTSTTFATTSVIAWGGAGGSLATGATSTGGQGTTANSSGTLIYAGGNGANSTSSAFSGGGGGAAGRNGTGGNATGGTGGTGNDSSFPSGPYSGNGGNGTSTSAGKSAGFPYGGGGGGGRASTATNRPGGDGAQGYMILEYNLPNYLTLNKVVDNSQGGTATTSDFTPKIDGVAVQWGVEQVISVASTSVQASETSVTNYRASSWGGDCSATGTISFLGLIGAHKTCTITNTFYPYLKQKHLIIKTGKFSGKTGKISIKQ